MKGRVMGERVGEGEDEEKGVEGSERKGGGEMEGGRETSQAT